MILYHGARWQNASGIMRSGFEAYTSTEGEGVYLWDNEDDAAEWAENPMSVIEADVDVGRSLHVYDEPLYILWEDHLDDLMHADTEWGKLNRQAILNTHNGKIPNIGEGWNPEAAERELTHLAKAKGYDSFYIRSGDQNWYVVFDPHMVHPLQLLYK